jgi:hypothetical protein
MRDRPSRLSAPARRPARTHDLSGAGLPGSRKHAERGRDIVRGPVRVPQVRPRNVVKAVERRENLVRRR